MTKEFKTKNIKKPKKISTFKKGTAIKKKTLHLKLLRLESDMLNKEKVPGRLEFKSPGKHSSTNSIAVDINYSEMNVWAIDEDLCMISRQF